MLVKDLGTVTQHQTLTESRYVALTIQRAVWIDTVAAVQLIAIVEVNCGASGTVGTVAKTCPDIQSQIVADAIIDTS